MEDQAIIELRNKLPSQYDVNNAIGFVDEEYRVDIEIIKDDEFVIGIQVKPSSYKYMREEVKSFNKTRNTKYGYDVKYLYYNDDEEFINLNTIIEDLE